MDENAKINDLSSNFKNVGQIGFEQICTLVEINSRINSHYSDVDALLVHILQSAMRLVDCEASSILLLGKDGSSLIFEVALGPKGAEAKKISVDKDSIAGWVVENNHPLILNDVASDPRFFRSVQERTGYVSRSMIAVPMRVKDECIGVIELINKSGIESFNSKDLALLELLSNQAGIAYMNADTYRSARDNISVLSNAAECGAEYHPFVAKSPAILEIMKVIGDVAPTGTTVLITGESGVGKELFAEQIHIESGRKGAFVRVNCAALSPLLLESELFGHVKGAFTDAHSDRVGRFESANGGTLFLDEIGELPLDLQAKLLRVIQERKFERVGSSETITADVRIVAATNRNLEEMVVNGTFRSDLFYRLNVVPIDVPPLRARKEDIEPLASFFLQKFSIETKKNFMGFDKSALKALFDYGWQGNIRELENSIERACVLGNPPLIRFENLGLRFSTEEVHEKKERENRSNLSACGEDIISEIESSGDKSLKNALVSFKRMYLSRIISECGGNQTRASEVLGVQRTYLSRLLRELSLRS